MRWLTLLVMVMGCTEHGKGGGDAWAVTETQFAAAICQTTCVEQALQDECIVDVLVDMDQARDLLPAASEAACIECMRVKIQAMPAIEGNGCEASSSVTSQITAACGAANEVCAGLP